MKSHAEGLQHLLDYCKRLAELIREGAPDLVLAGEVALILEAATLAFGADLYRRLGEKAVETARRHYGYCQHCETELTASVTHDPICEQCDAKLEAAADQMDKLLEEGE